MRKLALWAVLAGALAVSRGGLASEADVFLCNAALTSCSPVTASNPLPVTGSFSATTAATAASALPTLSPGGGASLYENLSGSLFVQPSFNGTLVDATHGLPVNVVAGGGSGGTSSSFGSAIPTTGTAAGFTDGTNMQPALVDASKHLVAVGAGTAGTATGGVLTVQGVASMTKLLVTPDSVALPANQSVNVSQVNGVTTLTGTGAVGTGAQRIAVGTDTATIAGSAPGTAGSASTNVVTVQGIASGTVLPVTATNLSVNLAQVNGVTTLAGAGASGTGAQRVTASQDTTTIAGSAPGTAGTPSTNVVSVQGVASGTNMPVSQATASNLNATVTPTAGTFSGCAGATEANTLTALINQTGNTRVITGTSSQKIRICAVNLVTATAQNIAVIEGSGSTCGTSALGLVSGGPAAATGWNFAANGGIALGNGAGVLARTTVNANDVCVFESGSGQVSGSITYTSF